MPRGTLYLIPVPLGDCGPQSVLPDDVLHVACGLRYFIVENAKSARAELKRFGSTHPIREIDIRELPRNPLAADVDSLLAPLLAGLSAGLMSEAGAPAVADPGALLVRAAHTRGIRVAPLVGPSSILLALMASGLNGQRFAFQGYLPVREPERGNRIAQLERESGREGLTQIFIETPYRNVALFHALLKTCKSDTLLCVAVDMTTPHEHVDTKSVESWRETAAPPLDKRPAVFLMLAR
jgi:16S rRNA (cytidine1402-2'-O)-methyltransferase